MTPEPARRHLRSRFLVDLALHRDGLREMFEAEPSACHDLLYRQTDQAAVADAGPLLIEPTSSDAQSLCRQWVERGLAIEMQGARPFADTAAHLRTLTMAECEEAPSALFRYADPRLYAGLCPVLGEHECARLLGPNETLTGVAAGAPWTLQQTTEEAQSYEPGDAPFRLTACHEQGLAQWRQAALLQPLASQYAMPIERLVGWFRQLQTMGFGNEQACLEGCRRLAEVGVDQPLDADRDAPQARRGSWQARLTALETHLAHTSGAMREAT